MEYERGDDITVAIKGVVRVAKYGEPAKWYEFKDETTVKLRVQEPMIKDVERARLPAFLRAKFRQHWGNVEIRGYDSRRGHTYFLEPGTYRVTAVETMTDRIKETNARRDKWWEQLYKGKGRNQTETARFGDRRQCRFNSRKPKSRKSSTTFAEYYEKFKR